MVRNNLQFADCSGRKSKMLDNIEECGIGNMEQVCRLFREWKSRETFDKIKQSELLMVYFPPAGHSVNRYRFTIGHRG